MTKEEVLTENSQHSRKIARKIILKENLIPYQCKECFNKGIWNNKKLVLQLNHINGIFNDHRLSNLEWLCPNCHSQTDTYGNRNPLKWKNGEKIDFRKEKKERPLTRTVNYNDVFDKYTELKNYTKTGLVFNISGNAVKKIILKYFKNKINTK